MSRRGTGEEEAGSPGGQVPRKKSSAKFRAKKFFGSRLSESKLGRKAIGSFVGPEGQYLILQIKLLTRRMAGKQYARDQKKKLMKLMVKVYLLFSENFITQQDGESLLLPLLYVVDNLIQVGATAEEGKLTDDSAQLSELLEHFGNLHDAILQLLRPLMKEKNSSKWTELVEFYGGKDFIFRFFTEAEMKVHRVEIMRMVQRLRDMVVQVMKSAGIVPEGYNEDYVNQTRELCAFEGCLKPRARPLHPAVEGLDVDDAKEDAGEVSVKRIRYCIEHQTGLAVKVKTRPTYELFFKTDYHRPAFVRYLSDNPKHLLKHLGKESEEEAVSDVGSKEVNVLLRFLSEVDAFKSINGKNLLEMRAKKILEKFVLGESGIGPFFPVSLFHALPVSLLEDVGAEEDMVGDKNAKKRQKIVSSSIFDSLCNHLESALRSVFEEHFLSSDLFNQYCDSLLPVDDDESVARPEFKGPSISGSREGEAGRATKDLLPEEELSSDDEEIIDKKTMKRLRAGTLL